MVLFMALLTIIAGAFFGLFVVLFVLPFIPFAVDALTNKPNRFRPDNIDDGSKDREDNKPRYEKSEFGFFTYLEPGRVKIVERGERFVRALMRFDDHMFLGERSDNTLQPKDEKYWEVVSSVDNTDPTNPKQRFKDSHPLPFPGRKLGRYRIVWLLYSPLSILWWLWKRWVYAITGAVFTGIYPYQKVRIYPIERFKKTTLENGEINLLRIMDYSDHYRVADFQFPFQVPQADTQNNLPVAVKENVIARVFNPYLTAYNTDDDWTTRLLASVTEAVTNHTRSKTQEEVLASKSKDMARDLSVAIEEVGKKADDVAHRGSTADFGVEIIRAQNLDITPVELKENSMQRRLADVALAKVDRAAREERAKGEAAAIRESGRALQEFPEAIEVARIEGLVRTAGAVSKEAIVILGGAQTVDPGQASLVRELRRNGPRTEEVEHVGT